MAYEFGVLNEDELWQIKEAYRKQKLKELLIGPLIASSVHVTLLIACAVFFVGESQLVNPSIRISSSQELDEVQKFIPPPPPPKVDIPKIDQSVSHDSPVSVENVPETAELMDSIEALSDEPPSTEANSNMDVFNELKASSSKLTSSSIFSGRSASGRSAALKKFGGSVKIQESYGKALRWLSKVQNPDGSWGDKQGRERTGLTALALLTFLAHGETPKSKAFGSTVSSAVFWLVNDDLVKDPYAHAIKTYALCEAYAMTGNYQILEKLDSLVDGVIQGQQPGGGYGYAYKNTLKDEKTRQDVSIAGWNYQAMKAAKVAGIKVKGLDESIEKSVRYLKTLASSDASGNGFAYNPLAKQRLTTHSMRAVGVLCLQLFGEGNEAGLRDELEKIYRSDLMNFRWNKPPKESLYGWYYATQCMFQQGGAMWKDWNAAFQKELKANQNPEGYWNYPGEVLGPKSDLSMKIYATSLCSLMLSVYYRYLPATSKSVKAGGFAKASSLGDEELELF